MSDEHPNTARVRALFHAFHDRGLAAVRDAIGKNAVWHFPGENLLAGSHRGHAVELHEFVWDPRHVDAF